MFCADRGRNPEGEDIMITRIRGAVAIAAVGLLALAACGDDDDSGSDAATTTAASSGTTGGSSGGDASGATEEEYLAAIETQFTSSGPDSLQMTEEQAKCAAPKWLDVITVEKLKEKGITPDDVKSDTDNEQLASLGLTEADADKMYDAYGECDVDVRGELARSIGASLEAPGDAEQCIGDALTDDLVRRIFVVSITKGQAGLNADEDLSNELFAALGACAPSTSTG
jgi:hypothetical protein